MNELNVIATARYLNAASVDYVCGQWKLSNEEAKALKFLVGYRDSDESNTLPSIEQIVSKVAGSEINFDEATLLLKFIGNSKLLIEWNTIQIPKFDVNGYDLILLGLKPGKEMGKVLDILRKIWVESGYSASRKDLFDNFVQNYQRQL